MVSVIMSTYNEKTEELQQAIESILNQTYKDIEFIIVDDNPSNDRLRFELEKYQNDERVRVIFNEVNIGLAQSLNKAIAIAKGDYIARMDADDISLPERIKSEVKFLEENSLDLVYCCITRMDETGVNLPDSRQDRVYTSTDVGKALTYGCTISHPTVLVKTETLKEMNGYRDLVPAEDYDLWLRMLTHKKKMGCLGERLLRYRVRSNSLSNSNVYRQYLMSRYVKQLYKKRIHGNDGYSKSSVERYLQRYQVNDSKKEEKYIKAREHYRETINQIKQRKILMGIINACKTICTCRFGFEMLYNTLLAGRSRL